MSIVSGEYDAASFYPLLLSEGFKDVVVCDYRQSHVPHCKVVDRRAEDSIQIEWRQAGGRSRTTMTTARANGARKHTNVDYFVHPQGLAESTKIGSGTRIWAFAHVLPGAVIGSDCNICDGVFIEDDVTVGDRVTIKNGVQLWNGLRVEDDVFIGPNATFTNDPFPRSKHHLERAVSIVLRRGASIGANATILPGLTVGRNAMVGAGAVVARDVPPNAIVMGNPAQIAGYAPRRGANDPLSGPAATLATPREPPTLDVPAVRVCSVPILGDMRGMLSAGEYGAQLPFLPKRYFIVFDVPSREVRGEHAHRFLHQFLVCVKGSCRIAVDDGKCRDQLVLDSPGIGLHIPPMVWATQYHFSPDCILLALASEPYDADEYIRDYDAFLIAVSEAR